MAAIPAEDPNEPLAADTFDDADSAISTSVSAGLTSLRSSVLKFQEENGRTYHSMSGGKYYLPNDDSENERLDLMHNVWLLSMRGELGLSPKSTDGAKRVLDVGTGTGIWAVELADMFPEFDLRDSTTELPDRFATNREQVVGVDLSPIQPSLVPPNCSFELDDIEKDWTWLHPFDFIFSRYMAGCFADTEEFINKAYKNLEPGGYLELQDALLPYESDDGTLPEENPIRRFTKLYVEAGKAAGRSFTETPKYKEYLERAGFVDVVEHRMKWPLNPWAKDPHYKQIRMWVQENLSTGIEGLMLALFTRYLGWTQEEVLVGAMEFREALKDRRIHAYCPIYVVYGRKPGNAPGTAQATGETAEETTQATTQATT